MSLGLTKLQTDILLLAQTRDLSSMTYREIAMLVSASHPYSIQQAVTRLIQKGKLVKNLKTGAVIASDTTYGSVGPKPLLNVPVLGRVSCGPALELAYDEPAGFITISPTAARIREPKNTYALIAVGDSMSSARINGKNVEDGDYVIVQKSAWGSATEGDYVISRFNGLNNLKKLRIDGANHRVILISETNDEYPPIIIDAQDMDYYAIEGIAIDIVKGVKQ